MVRGEPTVITKGNQRRSFQFTTVIIDHTTTSASGTARRVERWNAEGFTFVHAPVFMGPQNALSVHVSNVKAKLGADSRLEMALRARDMGLVKA